MTLCVSRAWLLERTVSALMLSQDVPLHVVCVCEPNSATQSLTRLLQGSLATFARSLPTVSVDITNDAAKAARISAGITAKPPASLRAVALQQLLFMTEVPKKPGVLEAALDFAKTVVCLTKGVKDSVFAGVHRQCASCAPCIHQHTPCCAYFCVTGPVARAGFRATVDVVCGGPTLGAATAAEAAATPGLAPRLSSITCAAREEFLSSGDGFSCMLPALVFVAQPKTGLLNPASNKCSFITRLLQAVIQRCYERRRSSLQRHRQTAAAYVRHLTLDSCSMPSECQRPVCIMRGHFVASAR
jgi:hypothetical protein